MISLLLFSHIAEHERFEKKSMFTCGKMKRKRNAIERDREGSGDMKETELYESVRGYFTNLGFTVRAEVRDIDICAVRDDLLVGIELKRNFSTDLLIQAVLRQKVCDLVYIAVPKPKRVKQDRSFRSMLHMLRRLELGLLYVDVLTGSVVEVLEPSFYDLDKARKTMMKTRRSILNEIRRRTLDGNVGGSNKTRLLTAYREESLKTIALIRHKGVISPKDLKGIGIRPGLLNNNFYGWFQKLERGRYALEEKRMEDYSEYEVYIDAFLESFRAEDLLAVEMPGEPDREAAVLSDKGSKQMEEPVAVKRPRRKKPSGPVMEKEGEKTGRAAMTERAVRPVPAETTPETVRTPKAARAVKTVRAGNNAGTGKAVHSETDLATGKPGKTDKAVRVKKAVKTADQVRTEAPVVQQTEGSVPKKRNAKSTEEKPEE